MECQNVTENVKMAEKKLQESLKTEEARQGCTEHSAEEMEETEQWKQHCERLKRCDRLLILEGIVLASMLAALFRLLLM